MGATYTIADYMGPFLLCTIGSILVVGILCVLLGRGLTNKLHRSGVTFLPLIGYACFLYLLGLYSVPILEQTGDLLIPNEYKMMTTAGKIENIFPAEHVPLYCIDGELRDAVYIVIGESSYYVISDDLLKEGLLIELQYAQFENNVVLSWQEVSADRMAMVLKEQLYVDTTENPEKPQKEVQQEIQRIGQVLVRFGFVGFIALLVVTNLVHHRIVSFILANDVAVHGQIIPNRIAVVFVSMPFVFLSMFIVGLSMMNGEYNSLLILTMGDGVMISVILVEQFTDLKIDGQYILIHKLGKEKQYSMTDLCFVKYKSCRGIIGKQLIVGFNDGKCYWFNMDHYLGVQKVYNTLKKHLDDLSNVALTDR